MPEHVSLDEHNPVWMRVVKILAEQMEVPTAQIGPDTRFRDLGADSLDRLQVILKLEEQFGITISDKDANTLQGRSASEVYDYVRFRV